METKKLFGANSRYEVDFSKLIFQNQNSQIYECKDTNSPFHICCAKYSSKVTQEQLDEDIPNYVSEMAVQTKYLVKVYHVEYIPTESKFLTIMERCLESMEKYTDQYDDFKIREFMNQILDGYSILLEKQVKFNKKRGHGKINPNNIFVRKFNSSLQYQLGDFLSQITSDNINFGYIAPELFPNKEKLAIEKVFYNDASDIYSLGMVLIKLILGQLPFENTYNDAFQFIKLIEQKPYQIKLNSGISPQLIDIIEKMILFNPAERITLKRLQENFVKKKIFSQTIKRYIQEQKIQRAQTLQSYILFSPNKQQQFSQSIIQVQETYCFKDLTKAKIKPQTVERDDQTMRYKSIKYFDAKNEIQNFIKKQPQVGKSLSEQVRNDYNNYLNGKLNEEELLKHYNYKSGQFQENEILFIYSLVALHQGHQQCVLKLTKEYIQELQNVDV